MSTNCLMNIKNIMNYRNLHILTMILASIFLIGCSNVSGYSGDGRLVDNGRRAATDRYILYLGPVDLSQKGTMNYTIKNLPTENFVIGLEIDVPDNLRYQIQKKAIDPTILLELSHSDGKVIFSKKSTLGSWAWSILLNDSKAFVYGRANSATFFTPNYQDEYTLTLTIIQPYKNKIEYSAQLLAKSGGWK